VYASLNDEFFDPKYGDMGLYHPSELMAHNQGVIFGLEGYSTEKTIVLFVHGISGTPRDWQFMADGLDRSRFQPLFFYYPSGLPLDKLGTLLAQVLVSLDQHSRKSENKIVLAAHSMGGLVALSAISKLSEEGLPSSLKLYCSLSTPYAGDDAARKGIEIAPVIVPVWRDIATESEFLKDLDRKPFPKQLPFYLYFSYLDTSKFKLGESSDGSVALRSQLVTSLQTSATKVLGFNETHVGILNSKTARDAFLRLLDTVTPPRKEEELR
jgi:pimeloyl-ACP methyl ester carboxylesterase